MALARTHHPTRWHIPEEPKTEVAPLLPGMHPLVDQLLRARGVTNQALAEQFLRPKLKHMHDPASLPGCVRAAQRLKQAVEDQQPIVIYGDYDVDGVTASSILYHTLTKAGGNCQTYVPHRLDEGYGLNTEAIQTLADQTQTKPLVVSVDCGITAIEPARIAKDLGVDLIITDHHEFDPDNLPDAFALVHPGLPNTQDPTPSTYPNRDLCGAGVAYKLAWQFALQYTGCEGGGRLPEDYRQLLLDLLAFAALGTVADVMPLVGENRAITAFGLRRISHTSFTGLNALIDASNLRSEKIDAYHIGFVLGPRLNACGRMGHAREAVELLTTAQGQRAKDLAEMLHHANEDRKTTERDIVEQATQMALDAGCDRDETRAVVLAHEDWHPGVVGIVASRLVERFRRPVVLLCIDRSTNTAKGSARSVDAVNLHDAIDRCREHLTTFGGHAMAAGLSLPVDRIDAFREALVATVNAELAVEDLATPVRVDATLEISHCSVSLFELLKTLAPFGRGNPKPRLIVRRVRLDQHAKPMGSAGKHLSLQLRTADAGPSRPIRAVGWGMGERADELPAGAWIDLVCQPEINEWRGNRSAELHVIDLRPAAEI